MGLNENRLIETLIRPVLNKYITHRQKHPDTITEFNEDQTAHLVGILAS